VLAAAQLTLADLYDEPFQHSRYGHVYAKYVYPDQRVVLRTADKQFPQPNRAKNKGRSLFHANKIGEATTVYVTEGEEDVYAVEAASGVAVCPAMGAGKAAKFDWTVLRGKDVRIIADDDEPGRKHAVQVAEQLDGIAKTVRILLPAVGDDASDHIAAGKTLAELVEFQRPSLLDQLGISGADLDAEEFAPLEFAVPGLISEGVGMLVGPPKLGKSWLVAAVALAVSDGDIALNAIAVDKRPVLYFALEDGKRRLQSRSRAISGGSIPKEITFIYQATAGEVIAAATEFMARHRDEKPLIIIDTLGRSSARSVPAKSPTSSTTRSVVRLRTSPTWRPAPPCSSSTTPAKPRPPTSSTQSQAPKVWPDRSTS
jgi:AAA domain/Toprim domain